MQEETLSLLLLPWSSCHLSRERRRAFIKKFATVVTSRPSCCAMVDCISLDGRFVSLNIACRVLRWMSVNTRRGFFGVRFSSGGLSCSCSFRLHAATQAIGKMTSSYRRGIKILVQYKFLSIEYITALGTQTHNHVQTHSLLLHAIFIIKP